MDINLRNLRMLTKAQYADFCQVSPKTVDVWRQKGRLREGEHFEMGPGGQPRFYVPNQLAPAMESLAATLDADRAEIAAEKAEKAAHAAAVAAGEVSRRVQTESQREARLLRTYGLTIADWDALFAHQRGQCAVCGREGVILHVDHDHDTGEVRGLLCNRCNTGLGGLGDSLKFLQAAVEYLRRPPAQDALSQRS